MSNPAPNTTAMTTASLKLVMSPPRGVYIAGHACYNCGHNREIIIFPALIETEGQLGLCSRCIKRAAKLLDLVNPVKMREDLRLANVENATLKRTVEEQATVIASYEALHKAKKSLDQTLEADQPIPGLEPASP